MGQCSKGSDGGGADSEHSLSCGSGPEAKVGSRDCFREEQEADASVPCCGGAWPGDTEVTEWLAPL